MATNQQLQNLSTIRKAVAEIISDVISMTGCPVHHIYVKRAWTGYILTQEFKDGVCLEVHKAFPEASAYWDQPNTFIVDYSYLPPK
jgi:quinol monooxygenase YgiN